MFFCKKNIIFAKKNMSSNKKQPVIKWSGSKRSQAEEIIKFFPKNINTYFEPFCGGASVFRSLINSDIQINNYVLSDINQDLICLWETIKNKPNEIIYHYERLWKELNKDSNIERKKEFYNHIRENFNKNHNPYDFMFIMRTTTNGMPRYNKNGDFNNSFHITRNGIQPDTLKEIVYSWCKILNDNNVQFICCDYRKINPEKSDFIYLDPPYANTKGMYYGGIDCDILFNYLRDLRCSYLLSFDGISGDIDNTYSVPNDVYDKHIYITSGNSSFKRTIGKNKEAIVQESLYVKYNT